MRQATSITMSALLSATALGALAPALAQTAPSEPEDVIVVRGANIPDQKRSTSEISSLLDEESFTRTGDSDIASALARVTGLSISQGKFIIVRGLNERYSNVTINGSPLPSPEPLQRVAPLDIVPTAILSGSVVQKTFSPEYSGEFGGGLIDLETKAVPNQFFFEIGGSLGIDTVTTFSDGLVYEGGETDWLGFDDGTRNTPFPLSGSFGSGVIQDQDAADVSVVETDTLLISENEIGPNYSFTVSAGDVLYESADVVIGSTVSLGLSSDWQTREGRREQGFINSAEFGSNGQQYDFRSTTNTVNLNAINTIGAEIGDNHEVTFTSFLLRSTLKEARISEGQLGDSDQDFLRTNTEFFERQVWQTQLRGEHVVPSVNDLSIEWRAAYGEAFRDSPFQRENAYVGVDQDSLAYDINTDSGVLANTLSFSKIEDENVDLGVDFVLPFEAFDGDHELKFGASYLEKTRDTLNRLFRIDGNIPQALRESRIDLILSEPVLGSSALDLELVGGSNFLDNTASDLEVTSYYGGVDLALGAYVRVAAGVRFEDGEQTTESFGTGQKDATFSTTTIDEDYLLPAATVTWNPAADLQLRAGYSQTITRPQFREVAPAFFIDESTDLITVGNPFLKNAEIDNYDIRGEYYFSRGQFVTLGVFFKQIENPIEDAFLLQQGGLPISSYINAPEADLYGFEFEFEKNFVLADIVDWAFVETKDLILKTNYTYTQSEVSDDGTVITPQFQAGQPVSQNTLDASGFVKDGRSLQGQSDHLFNLQLGVEDVEANSRATILINWASERIRNVEVFRTGVQEPAVLERPPFNVDFVYVREFDKFGQTFELDFNIRNILGDDYEAVQEFADGDAQFDTYDLGRSVSIGLKMKL